MIDKNRQDLYKAIWGIADELRGSVDGWDFRNYVLNFLFYRYISEDFCEFVKNFVNEGEDFDYSLRQNDEAWIESWKNDFIAQKGYFISPDQLFVNALKRYENQPEHWNEFISKTFSDIEKTSKQNESGNVLGLLSSMDLSNLKLGENVPQRNKKLSSVMKGIQKMNFLTQEFKFDVFGDAYEYLIGMYASNAGKSGGEFYTPPEVSELMVKLTILDNKKIKKIYDPTCGSGSLLCKFLKVCEDSSDFEFFGQEINLTTYNLCRMNMFLHGLNYHKFKIENGDTLSSDKFAEEEFDVIVSNPPYSLKWEGDKNPLFLQDPRFAKAGTLAPNSKADFAFIQHSVYHLNNKGIAAIVCFPGILYREGREKKIRKWLVDQNYVDAIIQLPENLFYGTSIAACIMILKNNSQNPNILFVDASEQFIKAKNRNRLGSENIDWIVECYKNRKDVENYSKLVSNEEVGLKDYNLSVFSHVIKEEQEENLDIVALNKEIKETGEKVNDLRRQIDELIKVYFQ